MASNSFPHLASFLWKKVPRTSCYRLRKAIRLSNRGWQCGWTRCSLPGFTGQPFLPQGRKEELFNKRRCLKWREMARVPLDHANASEMDELGPAGKLLLAWSRDSSYRLSSSKALPGLLCSSHTLPFLLKRKRALEIQRTATTRRREGQDAQARNAGAKAPTAILAGFLIASIFHAPSSGLARRSLFYSPVLPESVAKAQCSRVNVPSGNSTAEISCPFNCVTNLKCLISARGLHST